MEIPSSLLWEFMQTNRDVYGSVEFAAWARRGDVEPAESYLLRTFLDPGKRTLEAGTGGGRLLLALAELGFTQLYGFDFVPDFVAAARKRDVRKTLRLAAQDATRLGYSNASFDQIIYLQQVLSLIENQAARRQAMAEAFRVLRPGGVALFSFLSHEVRLRSIPYRLFASYLQGVRWVSRSARTRQTWPWLKLGGRFNIASLRDAGPYVYWYRVEEAVSELTSAGFNVRGVASRKQAIEGLILKVNQLQADQMEGALYCTCTK